MGSRYEVEVAITSAKDLKNVNWRQGPNKPYAVAWVDPQAKVSTRVDEEGDTCPRWDQTLVVPVHDVSLEDATLHVDIVHAYAAEDTKPLIGSAKLPLREVIDDVGIGGRAERELKLKRPSGRPQGKLEVKVKVQDTRYKSPDPYPAPGYGVRDPYGAPPSYGAPPPAYGAPTPAYGAPPQYGYAASPYAAPPSGYPYNAAPGYGQPGYGQTGYGQGGYGGEYKEEKKKSNLEGWGRVWLWVRLQGCWVDSQ